MFRRRSTETSQVLETDQAADADGSAESRPRPGVTAPKGVPTPKRSAAQANRRQPYQAPADRKAATRQSRDRDRSDRMRKTAAYQRGEQWALPRKDQGPVRALARDVVDARRGIGEYYMIMVFVLVVLLVIPSASAKLIADVLVIFLLLVMLGEGWWVGTKIKRLAAERYPGQSTQGVVLYATMRGISMRRMRVPKPKVRPGDKV
ncbi:MAG TPA: DUF3043 domain-containing protein [Streptosporangiaceae bacterium]|nr:DUF3043 domain-containing protein [Streptosporangiaceae bacterium]